jgi:formamidopyrimidine-DNA glycosylase
MPELPEVETIARELEPLVRDAVIVDAWLDWPRAVRHPAPDGFLTGLRGRRILGVGRRAKWLLLDLDGGAVLVIQVKMTGQLFVVPGGSARDRYVHFVLWLADGRELWLRDVRKFARLGLYRRD